MKTYYFDRNTNYEAQMQKIIDTSETVEDVEAALKVKKEFLNEVISCAVRETKVINQMFLSTGNNDDIVSEWVISALSFLELIIDDEDMLFDYCSSSIRAEFEDAMMNLRQAETLIQQIRSDGKID